MEADNYIPKLMRMFQMCEDLENTAGLHHLHDIIINLFQLNKNALIESMFKSQSGRAAGAGRLARGYFGTLVIS